jgi:pimeloyl-ACP methyl ester carboxylesterase
VCFRRIAAASLAGLASLWITGSIVFCEMSIRRARPVLSAPDVPVAITAFDGVVLRAAFVNAGRSDCVIVLHGIHDSHKGALGFAPRFVRAGYSVLAPDARGHGASAGDLVTFGVLEANDVLRWISCCAVRRDASESMDSVNDWVERF